MSNDIYHSGNHYDYASGQSYPRDQEERRASSLPSASEGKDPARLTRYMEEERAQKLEIMRMVRDGERKEQER